MNEIIAAVAILILIVIYFIIKKSQAKQKNILQSSEPTVDKQENHVAEEVADEKVDNKAIEDILGYKEMTKDSEAVVFDALNGEEEGSFGEEAENNLKNIEEETPFNPLARIKRAVPPHGKITKDNFKEFAGKKILIAEDNIINQKVITGLLVDSGIELTMADDGQFTLDILEENSDFDFILMDAHMPRIDGFEATRIIRKNPQYNHIVIIALSGDTATDDVKKMKDAGMEEHLEKPLKMESLYCVLYAYAKTRSADNEDSNEFINATITKEIDTDKGLGICGDDEEFYHEILDEFINTYSESTTKLQELLNHSQLKEADQYLLDISGVSANIGANNISRIVLEFKRAIADPKDKRYAALFKEYEISLQHLLEDIQEYKKNAN